MNGLAVCGILAGILYFLLFNTTPIYFILIFVSIYFALSWLLIPSSASKFNSVRRKIQISTWSDPVRPLIMGYFQVKVSNTLQFLEKSSKDTGESITMTHLILKAIGTALQSHPDVCGKIALGNYSEYKTVDATCLVSLEDGNELFSIKIKDIPHKPISVIAKEIREKSDPVKLKEEREKYGLLARIVEKMPTCVTAVILEIFAFFVYGLGIPLPMFNLEKNHFGTFVLRSIEKSGIRVSYSPLIPLTKNPLVVCPSGIFEEVVVRDSKVGVEKVMNVCCTVDHRFVDGTKALAIQNRIKEVLENPFGYLEIN